MANRTKTKPRKTKSHQGADEHHFSFNGPEALSQQLDAEMERAQRAVSDARVTRTSLLLALIGEALAAREAKRVGT